MYLRKAANDVFSDLFVNISAVLLVSIPGYILVQDWLRLTTTLFLCILTTWVAISTRSHTYGKSD